MSSTLWIIWERYCYLFVQLECERTVSCFCSVLLIFASNRAVGSPLHRYVFFFVFFFAIPQINIWEQHFCTCWWLSLLCRNLKRARKVWVTSVWSRYYRMYNDNNNNKKKDTAVCIKVACIKKWATSIYSFIFLSNCIFFGELFSQLE